MSLEAFQSGGAFQPDAFQGVAQEVAAPTFKLEIAPQVARVKVTGQPLIALADRFLIVGQRIDLASRRFGLIAEQVIFRRVQIVALVHFEPWEIATPLPGVLVHFEPWELAPDVPDTLAHFEGWES